ncbi:hypothetical protein [Pedobacter cryoconitis]|uniref:Lasso RiPP family leader peptide-containing protein n=1 Tax=Pedobacter cryoconitis TaxID=188932 RepID=A0A7X0J3V3_9SPHI|nr:hypothetical protein [Pedobacter cryoconitis]MBB6499302.1 hypothetical protein [Pedobacter cryoconitis]
MQKEEATQNDKKVYQTPELKDLGKIGEVTNTTNSGHGNDGGTSPNYNS